MNLATADVIQRDPMIVIIFRFHLVKFGFTTEQMLVFMQANEVAEEGSEFTLLSTVET